MKKLLETLVISSTLALSATAAFADNRIDRVDRVDDHRTERPDVRPDERMFKPAPPPELDSNVIDAQRAFGRRGTVTLTAKTGFGKQGDLFVLSSDNDVDIRFVKITYARGRIVMLRGSRGRALDLPDGGRIKTVEVSYVNRGNARGAMIKLIAKGGFGHGDPGRGGMHRGFGHEG
jgi:hypothetical protein